MRTFFKVMLYLLVPQLLIMGALALLAPEAAARIWNFPLKDPALARIVGPSWIALASSASLSPVTWTATAR